MAAENSLLTAYISIIPSFRGGVKEVSKELGKGVDGSDVDEKFKDKVTEGAEDAAKELPKEFEDAGDKSGKSFGEKFKSGLNIASAAIVGGIAAGAAGLYNIGDTFDNVADTIRAGTGATGADLDALIQSARNIGSTVPAEFDAIGSTVADLNTRFGLTGETLETVAAQTLEAGRVFDEELDINALSKGFSAFSIEGKGVAEAMDYVFVASQATGVSMNELAQKASDAAPQMKALGFSFEDTVSMVGQFDKAGLNSSAVMSTMSRAVVNLAKDGEAPADAFRRVVGEIEGFVKAGDQAAALELASKVFGTRGATQFTNAIAQGVLNVKDLQAGLGATGDTILGVGEETMDFAEKWQMFLNRAMVAIEPLATKVFGAAGDALDVIAPKVESFFTWMENNTETVKTIGIIVGALAGSILALNGALTAYNAISGAVKIATMAWTGVQWLLNTALLANPIGLIVLGVGLLIGLVVLLVKNWDAVTAAVGNFVSWAGEGLGKVGALIGEFAGSAGAAIGGFFSGIGQGIANAAGTLVGAVGNMLSSIGNFFTGVGSGISDTWNRAIQGGTEAVGWIQGKIGAFFTWVGSGISRVAQSFQAIGKGIGNFFVGIVNTVISAMNFIIGGMNRIQFKAPDWMPNIGGRTFGVNIPQIPSVPALATGADVMGPTLALIGEKDPETVINRGVANKVMDSQAEALKTLLSNGGGGGGVNVYLSVNNAQNLDEETLAERLTEMISERVAWEQKR